MHLLIFGTDSPITKLDCLTQHQARYMDEFTALKNQLADTSVQSVILIDLDSTAADPIKLCRDIRQIDTQHPLYIILLSSNLADPDFQALLELDADDYIIKPYSEQELTSRLQLAQRNSAAHKELQDSRHILRSEKSLIENILLGMRQSKPFSIKNLRFIDKPVERTSGDIILSAVKTDGTQHILLGDFTGHGLTAAICSPIVYDVFYSMTQKNFKLCDIITEMNRQLLEKMPPQIFMAAIFIEFNPVLQSAQIWNCGMSDVLLYRNRSLDQCFRSAFFSLGIAKQDFSSNTPISLQTDDRIFAYSDGITEAVNEQNEEFGQQRLQSAISEILHNNLALDHLLPLVETFQAGQPQTDDITVLELSWQPVARQDFDI